MKKLQFFMGLYLVMQTLTCFLLVILFLIRGKKKTAGVFLTAGSISGIFGGFMLYKQIKAKMEDSKLSALIDDLCSFDQPEPSVEEKADIPLDELATETDFQA